MVNSAGPAVDPSLAELEVPSMLAEPELTVVMPCLNEAETLAACILQIQGAVNPQGIATEILVADNGSTDGSIEIAEGLNARVVRVTAKGYGNALRGGIEAARGRYVMMGDADMSYNFGDIPKFLADLRSGADLVMGNRFLGGVKPGAMPPLHRYLGNPVLTTIGRLFFRCPAGDFHCGLRGFSKDAYRRMDLQTTGMEFASEMVVKSSLFGMKITEVPTTLSPDGRSRPPHLRSWRDGWRHLRFLLLYSPRWLFLYPGLALMLTGLLAGLWLLPGPRPLGHTVLDVHTLLYAACAFMLGYQAVSFALFTKIFAIREGLLPEDARLSKLFRYVTLETGLIIGAALLLLGLAGSFWAVSIWSGRHFGNLDAGVMLRRVLPSVLALMVGGQTIFSSFFLSVLGMRRR